MDALQESGWEELRKEARKIEGDLDVKLSSYAKLGARFTQGGNVDAGSPTVGSSRSWKSMEMEIESLLEKLLDINDSMSRSAASAASTTSVTQKLARHRDILHEFTQLNRKGPALDRVRFGSSEQNSVEFKRIKGNINSMREHAELLTSVRDDISEYKASGSASPRMQLLRERAAIHGSISHIDDVISQAQATRAVLGSQRTLFGDVQGKVKLLGDKFPVISGLIGSIRRKRSRDTLILSAVIAALLAHSFDPSVKIFQVKRDSEFSEVYMESVVKDFVVENGGEKPKVGLMVMPGFWIGGSAIQSQVYLTGIKVAE
ncbi:Golgi SNAP receptor complex member 1-2 [Orobanche gracilis]